MNWIEGIQKAIEYIETHLAENIDYEEVAKIACSSSYHFQRIFGILCGISLGEYIRRRRLTVAGNEILSKKIKVTDLAFKYGYDTPESFSRAFIRFHGIKPSHVKKGCSLNSFSRLSFQLNVIGGNEMKYTIKELPEFTLVGYKKHFSGVPYGEERTRQEKAFVTTTRAKQWLLIGASCDYANDYCVIANVDDYGYDFYIAYKLDEWTRTELYNPKITGVNFMHEMEFETIIIPKSQYAVFATEKQKRPIDDYIDMRKKIASEWLPSSEFVISNAPEITMMHWRENKKEKYIEVYLPIENKI